MEWIASSCLLILVVLALRAALGKRIGAGLRYGLWAVVLVRLLVPVSFLAVTVPQLPVCETPEVLLEESIYILPVDSKPLEESSVHVAENGTLLDPGSFGYARLEDEGRTVTRYANRISLLELLYWTWAAGAAVMGAALIAANLRFVRRLRRMRRRLEGIAAPVPVYVSAGLPSPCLMGLLRPAVYVTEETAADPIMLRHVLVHELTHYNHRDHLWSALRGVALAVHWWNPLVWLAVVCSRRDGELACDEGALKRLGDGERTAYGETLLALVTAKSKPGDLLCFATTMSGGKRSLRERIQCIACQPRRLVSAMVIVIAVLVLSSLVAFGQAKDTGTPDDLIDQEPAANSDGAWQDTEITPSDNPEEPWTAASSESSWVEQPDLDHDGKPDVLDLRTEPDPSGWSYDGTVWTLQCGLSGGGAWEIEGRPSLPGENAVFLYRMNGEDYLLVYTPEFWHGQGYYEYRLIWLDGGREVVVQENSVGFDVRFRGGPEDIGFDPEAIASFMDEVNALLADSVQLVNTNIYLEQVFAGHGRLYDDLYWLDDKWRENGLTLLESLQNYGMYFGDHPDSAWSPLADLLEGLTEEDMASAGNKSLLVNLLRGAERGSRFYTWNSCEDAYEGAGAEEVDYIKWDVPLADGSTLWLLACEERSSVLMILDTENETASAFYTSLDLKDAIVNSDTIY